MSSRVEAELLPAALHSSAAPQAQARTGLKSAEALPAWRCLAATACSSFRRAACCTPLRPRTHNLRNEFSRPPRRCAAMRCPVCPAASALLLAWLSLPMLLSPPRAAAAASGRGTRGLDFILFFLSPGETRARGASRVAPSSAWRACCAWRLPSISCRRRLPRHLDIATAHLHPALPGVDVFRLITASLSPAGRGGPRRAHPGRDACCVVTSRHGAGRGGVTPW